MKRIHCLSLTCISNSHQSIVLFSETEKYIRRYKTKKNRGEKVCFFDKKTNSSLKIDTNEQDTFVFSGDITSGYNFVSEQEELLQSLAIFYAVNDIELDRTQNYPLHKSAEDAFVTEIKPIFDVMLSILNFVGQKNETDWKDHLCLSMGLHFKEAENDEQFSYLYVSTSNNPRSDCKPSEEIIVSFIMSESNPLFEKICSFSSKKQFVVLDYPPDSELKMMTLHCSDSDIEELCSLFKLKNIKELQQISAGVIGDSHFNMYIEIYPRKVLFYDENAEE